MVQTPFTASTDGVIVLRPSTADDRTVLIAGRDEEFHRFLGEGSDEPSPTAVITVAGECVGWIDYDVDRNWLAADEVNIGYNVFAPHRGNGYGTRALRLLLAYLATETGYRTATLLIRPENERSLALAARAGFQPAGEISGSHYFICRVGEI